MAAFLLTSKTRQIAENSMMTSLSTIVLNSRDRQGMYGMQHFRASNNKPYNKL